MACADWLNCTAQGLSFAGTVLAGWQGYRASQLLKTAHRLRGGQPPPRQQPAAPPAGAEPDTEIPLQAALDTTADALEGDAKEWSLHNHVLLLVGITLVLIGSGLATYRAFNP
jgi:hypothetical protein